MKGYHFTTSDFESMGMHFCDTLMDYCDPDPTKTSKILIELEAKFRQQILVRLQNKGIDIKNIDLEKLDGLKLYESDINSSAEDGSDSSVSDGLPMFYEYLKSQMPSPKKVVKRKTKSERDAIASNVNCSEQKPPFYTPIKKSPCPVCNSYDCIQAPFTRKCIDRKVTAVRQKPVIVKCEELQQSSINAFNSGPFSTRGNPNSENQSMRPIDSELLRTQSANSITVNKSSGSAPIPFRYQSRAISVDNSGIIRGKSIEQTYRDARHKKYSVSKIRVNYGKQGSDNYKPTCQDYLCPHHEKLAEQQSSSKIAEISLPRSARMSRRSTLSASSLSTRENSASFVARMQESPFAMSNIPANLPNNPLNSKDYVMSVPNNMLEQNQHAAEENMDISHSKIQERIRDLNYKGNQFFHTSKSFADIKRNETNIIFNKSSQPPHDEEQQFCSLDQSETSPTSPPVSATSDLPSFSQMIENKMTANIQSSMAQATVTTPKSSSTANPQHITPAHSDMKLSTNKLATSPHQSKSVAKQQASLAVKIQSSNLQQSPKILEYKDLDNESTYQKKTEIDLSFRKSPSLSTNKTKLIFGESIHAAKLTPTVKLKQLDNSKKEKDSNSQQPTVTHKKAGLFPELPAIIDSIDQLLEQPYKKNLPETEDVFKNSKMTGSSVKNFDGVNSHPQNEDLTLISDNFTSNNNQTPRNSSIQEAGHYVYSKKKKTDSLSDNVTASPIFLQIQDFHFMEKQKQAVARFKKIRKNNL